MAKATATAKALDFTNVKERSFNTKNLPEGDYPAKVLSVQDHKAKKSGTDMWLFTIGLTGGGAGAKGASYPYYCGLDADSLWKVRNLFAACGVNIPKKRVKVDPSKVVGRALGVTLEDDEYEGKPKSAISAVMPVSEIDEGGDDDDDDDDEETETEDVAEDDDDDEEEPPAKKSKAKAKAKPAEDEDEDDDAEVTEDELDELEIEEV